MYLCELVLLMHMFVVRSKRAADEHSLNLQARKVKEHKAIKSNKMMPAFNLNRLCFPPNIQVAHPVTHLPTVGLITYSRYFRRHTRRQLSLASGFRLSISMPRSYFRLPMAWAYPAGVMRWLLEAKLGEGPGAGLRHQTPKKHWQREGEAQELVISHDFTVMHCWKPEDHTLLSWQLITIAGRIHDQWSD